MKLINDWCYFGEGLDAETCDKLIALGDNEFEAATTVDDNSLNDRRSEIAWVNEQWVTDIIWPYMLEANERAGWNFDIESVESIQITKYGLGGFYKWHYDGGSDMFAMYSIFAHEFLRGNVRKLSMTIQLNDDFEGGDFQIALYDKMKCEISEPDVWSKGSIIVFPSFKEHRVSPITKGIRYSLVAWFLGKPFK